MRRAALPLTSFVLLVSACSDDLSGPGAPVFEARCGVEGPLQVIELGPNRTVEAVALSVIGDRLLYRITTDDDEQLWSVGRCGEDPSLLLEGEFAPVVLQFIDSPWPDVRFVCPVGSQIRFAIDPTGAHAPQATFAAGDCAVDQSTTGLVTVLGEGEVGTLVFQPWPSDPFTQQAEPIVLLDGIRTSPHLFEPSKGAGLIYAATVDEALAVTIEGELVAVRLDDFTLDKLVDGVLSFTASRDGQWVMYESQHGGLHLLDRGSRESMYLADTPLAELSASDPMRFSSIGLLYYAVGTEHHYLRVPELTEFVASADPLAIIDATRGLIDGEPPAVLNVTTGETAQIPDLPAFANHRIGDTGITALSSDGRLEHFDFDGNRELLARFASQGWTRADNGQVFTLENAGTGDRGPLIAIDPKNLDERYVDEDVLRRSLDAFVEDDQAVVSYAVMDPERYGIWLAQPDP